MRVLVIGCGYVGLRLANELKRRGHEVIGTSKSLEKLVVLESDNIPAVQLDISDSNQFGALNDYTFDWVVNCAAPGHTSVQNYVAVYYQGNANILNWLKCKEIKKYVYTSSTGVYGQNDGSIVTEESPTFSNSETGRILIMTEELILKMFRAYQVPVVILRLAGLYGNERGYYFKQFISGNATLRGDGNHYLNMVHVDDAVGAIIAALERGAPGEIYNVVDNEPVREIDFYKWLSDKLNKPMPPAVSPNNQSINISGRTVSSNKQVSNLKIREKLGYEFKYPTFREGYESKIKDILSGQNKIQ
ncbi:MAG: SDR family oxidoreductase [Verrucomicrobiia bacterium]